MPVDYTIASRVAPASGGMDPLNAFAQMQGLSYRQQQNALAQMQMQEYQRKMQIQNALGGVLADPNFNVMSPEAVARLVRSGNLSEGLSVLGAQRQAAALAEQAAAHKSTAAYQAGMLDVAREKLPLEKEVLEFQKSKEGRQALEALRKADAATIDLAIKQTAQAQDYLTQSSPETWSDDYARIKKADPQFAAKFKPDVFPDRKLIDTAMKNADLTRKIAETRASQLAQAEFAPPQMPAWAPGYNQRFDPNTNQYYLEAPAQPGAPRMPVNALAAPSAPQNVFTGQPLTPMTPATPVTEEPPAPGRIKATAAPMPPIGTPEYEIRRSARSVLDIAGVDIDKGTNRVSDLIKNTPSSAFRAYAQQKEGAFKGKATPEMENVGRLNTIIDNMVLAATNNKLGGQVSDADVRLLKEAQALINDPSIQPNQRLAAWDEVLRIKAKQAGYSYTPMELSQIRGQPIIGQRKPAAVDENAILTDVFGPKK